MSTITYTVTVASAKFTIDDAVAPKLTFRDGDTYEFDQADSSNSGHILQFSITSNNSGASEYTTGVTKTGTPGSAGAKTVIITSTSTTDTLYYYSSGGGTHGEEFSNSGFTTSTKNLLKPIVGAEATAEKWGAMINHTIDQIDSITLSNPVITSFQYSDGASATAEKTVLGLISLSCTTQTSTTVLASDTTGIQVGMVVAGTGIPVGATVESIIIDTSFVLSAAATASATVTLTFGGAVIITGASFDSILGGSTANIAVTFDGTSATSISVNALKTIITCTPPAHAAGTITLKVTNDSGLSAETNFIYSAEAAWSATGALGSFVDGAFTNSGTVIRVQATEASDTITYAQTNSAGVVNTTGVQGLTLGTGLGSGANSAANAGYLTGTLSATEGTTYTFYATATDAENQVTTPTLFNIISAFPPPTGGTLITSITGFRVHVWATVGTFSTEGAGAFINGNIKTIDYIVLAGGGGGGTYDGTYGSGLDGGNSSIASLFVSTGGGGGGGNASGRAGGSGGGAAHHASHTVGAGTAGPPRQGYDGGLGRTAGSGYGTSFLGGGGGGAGAVGGAASGLTALGDGGDGRNDMMGMVNSVSTTFLTAVHDEVSGAGGVMDGDGYRYLAGGGGAGAANFQGSLVAGTGGKGGGGAGGVSPSAGSDAVAKTGGGAGSGETGGPSGGGYGGGGAGGLLTASSYSIAAGTHAITVGAGGAGYSDSGTGGAGDGGSGLVIIRYAV